jgi:DNA-nicking Smr family endonuclease
LSSVKVKIGTIIGIIYRKEKDRYSTQMKSRDLIIAKSAERTDVREHFERISKPGSSFGFSVSDQELWKQFSQSIRPLKETHCHAPLHAALSEKGHTLKLNNIQKRTEEACLERTIQNLPLDGHGYTSQKPIRVKKICIDARLDLHGLTRVDALSRVQKFLLGAQARGNDWVLVITGKGEDKNPSTLRKLLPQWLDHIPQASGYAPAKPKDGGSGAWYVKIRRVKMGL